MTHSFDKNYWDQTWGGERAPAMSSSDPNPHLLREIGELGAGTAIDAGCGAGAEAIWLAKQGWDVTGVDVADAALGFAEGHAAAAGIEGRIEWVQADLSSWEPEAAYDLVTTHYAHPAMGQLDFYERLASWVAPGGTLFIVGHLHHDHGDGGHGKSHPPAEASTTAESITDRLDPAVWTVVTAEESQRTMVGPGGRTITIEDVVVKAGRGR